MKEKFKLTKKTKQNILIFLITAGIFSLVLLSFWPGLFSYDSFNQWGQIEAGKLENNHPFFSTFIWWLLSRVWYNKSVLLIFQIILASYVWTKITSALRTEKNFKWQIVYTVLVSFVPIIFAYVITAWKDIIYSYNLLLLSLMIYIGVIKKFKYSYLDLFILTLSLVFSFLYRFNGILVSVITVAILLFLFIKNKVGLKKTLIWILMLVVTLGVCKLPEKIMYVPSGNEDASSEAADVIYFTFAPFAIEDKVDDEEDIKILNDIYPIDKLKEEYNHYCINMLSKSEFYNRKEYLENHKTDIIKMLVKYSLKHPGTLISHYLKSDNLLIGIRYGDGYIYVYPYADAANYNFDESTEPIIKPTYDMYSGLIKLSETQMLKKFYLPGYAFYISIIIMIYVARREKNGKLFLCIMPMLLNTITLLPINIAQDLRYAYINYLTLLLIAIPMLIFKRKEYQKEELKKKDKVKTLVIVPAYNEELNLEKTIKDIKENAGLDYIIINDCSKDNTVKLCKEKKFNYLDLPVNYGLTSGIQLGMKYALKHDYDIAIQFDGDGQHKAEYLKALADEIKNGNCNIAIGSRFVTAKKPKSMRMLGNNLIQLCIKITTGKTIKDPTSGMRAYDKSIIEEFAKNSSLTPEPDTLVYMLKHGKEVKEVQVEMRDREFGESYLKPLKAASYMINQIFSILCFRSIG